MDNHHFGKMYFSLFSLKLFTTISIAYANISFFVTGYSAANIPLFMFSTILVLFLCG